MTKKLFLTLFLIANVLALSAQTFTYNGKYLATYREFTKQASPGSTTSATPEVSGLAASRTTEGFLWANCDDPASTAEQGFIYALNANGTVAMKVNLSAVGFKRGNSSWKNEDWEDICMASRMEGNIEKHYIIVGAFGDNDKKWGTDGYYLYIIEEPEITSGTITITADNITTIKYFYPNNESHNTESVMYDPIEDIIVVINKDCDTSKRPTGIPSKVFSTPFSKTNTTVTLTEVATLGLGIEENRFFACTSADISKDGRFVLVKSDNNSDGGADRASVAYVVYWERCATETFTEMMNRSPKYVAGYGKNDDYKGEGIAWSLDALSFITASDASGASAMNLYTRSAVPETPACGLEEIIEEPEEEPINLPVNPPVTGDFWIDEDFSSITSLGGSGNYTAGVASTLTSAPNNIALNLLAVDVESLSGTCYTETASSNQTRIREVSGYIEFTVENAGTIRISLKAKSTSANRNARVLINGEMAAEFTGLDNDNCAVFEQEVNSENPVTVRIMSPSSGPLVVNRIQVTKYAPVSTADALINDDFAGQTPSTGYATPSFVLQGTAGIMLTLNACDIEPLAGTGEGNDDKELGTPSIRVGDNGRQGHLARGGYVEFTLPAGTGVGTIRMHIKAKGTANNRTAIISINGEDVAFLDGLGLNSGKEYLNVIDGVLDADMTIRLRSNDDNPLILNSILVTAFGVRGSECEALVSELQIENENLQNDVAALLQQIADLQNLLNVANETIGTLETQNSGLQSQLNTANETAGTLQAQNSTLQNQLNTANGTIGTLQTQHNDLQSQLNTANGTVGTLQTQHNDLQSRLNTANETIGTLQSDLSACESDKDNLQNLLDACSTSGTTNTMSVQSASSLRIYPNPISANGVLNIEKENLKAGDKIEIFNMSGNLVSIYFATGTESSINIGSLAQGIYLLRLAGENGVKFEVR